MGGYGVALIASVVAAILISVVWLRADHPFRISESVAGRGISPALVLLTPAAVLVGTASPAGAAVPSAGTDVNPSLADFTSGTLFGGRTEAFVVNPVNANIVFAATEFGGLWKSTDHGNSWSHLDAVPLTNMQDVKFSSSDANLVIATGGYDGSIDNRGGGIWRSTDGGTTWAKAPFTNFCVPLSSNGALKIVMGSGMPGHITVFVGTNCGLAKSTDSGATWSLLSPPGNSQIWSVSVRVHRSELSSGRLRKRWLRPLD